jgi:hypothetical protein
MTDEPKKKHRARYICYHGHGEEYAERGPIRDSYEDARADLSNHLATCTKSTQSWILNEGDPGW